MTTHRSLFLWCESVQAGIRNVKYEVIKWQNSIKWPMYG